MTKLERDLSKYIQDRISGQLEIRMVRAIKYLKAEIQLVIDDYYSGNLGRKQGSLIDTGKYRKEWNTEIEKKYGELIGRVTSSTEYAEFLENGTSTMEGFRVVQIALLRAEPRLEAIFKGEA